MSGLIFTLLAVLVAGLGARDQILVAQLSAVQGGRIAILATGGATACLAAAAAAWAATVIAPMLFANARLVLAAMALGLAGAESLIFAPRPRPQEPTHSLGALAIVLLAHQFTDAARFLVFAIAAATAAPLAAGAGGALGGVLVVGLGWAMPDLAGQPRLRLVRRGFGLAMLAVATGLALEALT